VTYAVVVPPLVVAHGAIGVAAQVASSTPPNVIDVPAPADVAYESAPASATSVNDPGAPLKT
jgi:hypothetical protein